MFDLCADEKLIASHGPSRLHHYLPPTAPYGRRASTCSAGLRNVRASTFRPRCSSR